MVTVLSTTSGSHAGALGAASAGTHPAWKVSGKQDDKVPFCSIVETLGPLRGEIWSVRSRWEYGSLLRRSSSDQRMN